MTFFQQARDPISSLTHSLGALLSILTTILMVTIAIANGHPWPIILALAVFGLSLLALYSASAYYHYIKGSAKKQSYFRKLDHAMIYVLIAGTYTPVCLAYMLPSHRAVFLTAIWGIAIAGIVAKMLWINAPRWLSTGVYLLMGWAIVFDASAFSGIPGPCLALIAAGGIAYSIGAVIYWLKKPNFTPGFGFHELFHCFILLGSLLHVLAIFLYIV